MKTCEIGTAMDNRHQHSMYDLLLMLQILESVVICWFQFLVLRPNVFWQLSKNLLQHRLSTEANNLRTKEIKKENGNAFFLARIDHILKCDLQVRPFLWNKPQSTAQVPASRET